MELTDRKKRVLRAIVETYINTAEPVAPRPSPSWLDWMCPPPPFAMRWQT